MVSRDNNFNFLRLFLATQVIFVHSFEFKEGSRAREPFTSIFHTVSIGDLALYGFFLLSGYLILQSWHETPRLGVYLKKRVGRIYPAFLVAMAVCALIVGPLGAQDTGKYFADLNWAGLIGYPLALHLPHLPETFVGPPYPCINGAVWTILVEFRFYLLVAIVGLLGGFRRRGIWLTLTILAMAASALPDVWQFDNFVFTLVGDPVIALRLFCFFAAGGCFFLYRDKIKYDSRVALLFAPLILLSLYRWDLMYRVLPTLGAYVFFWFAFLKIPFVGSKFFRETDISYGTYLYGTPVLKLLLWYCPFLPVALAFPLATTLSLICGLLSWNIVEKPVMQSLRKDVSSDRLEHSA